MTSVYSPDSASSSTTLHPSQNQYVSLDDASRIDLSDSIGTVFSGIQLSALGQDYVGGLAKVVAERGVLFFEGQYDFTPSEQDRFIAYLDPSHDKTSTSKQDSTQKPGPEVTPSLVQHEWQSDSTHQAEPPSLSMQVIGESETIMAETAWVSQYGVYDSLSSPVQRLVAEVTAFHGSGKQTAEHPAVRTHPITSLRALNIVLGNVTWIPQLKKKESGTTVPTRSNDTQRIKDLYIHLRF
jgi:alpha-ketoglutarate-dependent taurine dioxygenase